MDREQLKEKLESFRALAEKNGYPLTDLCIEEAYPGDSSSSYIIKVLAPWVDNMDCSQALDILIDILWETVDEETRKYVFAINIHDSQDLLHCATEDI